MTKIQMPASTDSSTKHTVTKAPLDGATSSEAKLHQHGNEQLHATTTRDNRDIPTTQHCGQEKPLTKCGPHFEPFGYAAMENYTENTMKNSNLAYSPPNNMWQQIMGHL
jgi:hypothetical protein